MDLHIGYVFRVAAVALSFVVLEARTSVNVHETVIVSRSNDLFILTHLYNVNVAAISAWWVDALDEPAEFHCQTRPCSGCGG